MSNEVAEYVAAALVEVAGTMDRGINVKISDIYAIPETFFKVVVQPSTIDSALKILQECKIAYVANDAFAGKFVKITRERFDALIKGVETEILAYNKVVADADDPNSGLNQAESMSWPSLELIGKYKALKKYSEFGSEWIAAAMPQIPAEGSDAQVDGGTLLMMSSEPNITFHPAIDSSAWTGLPSTFVLTEQKRELLSKMLQDAESALDSVGASNQEKAMARAYIVAAKTLADAPEPPADLIWELINRANQISGVAALLVSIIGLFV